MSAVRGNLKQYAIGAAGGAVASVAIVALYLIVTANARGADGGDWLAFAGVFFGVMATMLGTIGVERYKEREKDREVIAALRVGLSTWIETVDSFPANQTNAVLRDMEQQVGFLASVAGQLGRNQLTAMIGMSAFNFHVPTMIDALRTNLLAMARGPQHLVQMNDILRDMRHYAVVVQGGL